MKDLKTKTVLLVLLWLMAGISPAISQGGYAKIIQTESHFINLDIDDILYNKDQLIVRGNAYIDSARIIGFYIAGLDTNGIVLWHNSIYDTTRSTHIITNTPVRIIVAKNGNIMAPNYYFNSKKLVFTSMDSLGQLIFMKEYDYTGQVVFPYDVKEHDNYFYLFGMLARENNSIGNFILKVDSLGNQVWLKYYGLSTFDEFFGDVILNENGTFTISSARTTRDYFHYSGEILPGWKAPWIFTIDTSGQVIDQWIGQHNDSTTLGSGPLHRMPNGDLIVAAHDYKVVPHLFSTQVRISPTVTRLDSNFNLIWKRNLTDFITPWDYIEDMEYDAVRDEIVIAGNLFVQVNGSTSHKAIWVVKLDGDGNILWEIAERVIDDPRFRYETAGVEISPSGSIYVAGWVEPDSLDGWILKVTQDGCAQPLCTTTSIAEQIMQWDQSVVIYPNPAKDHIMVQLKEPAIDPECILHDIYGREVLRVPLTSYLTSVPIDCSPGMYVCTITSGGKVIYSGKCLFL